MYKIVFYFIFLLHLTHQAPQKIIVDTDGGIDDLQALAYLLNADAMKVIKIEAIVSISSNIEIEVAENNIFRFLDTAGRLDIPIYSGAYRSLIQGEHPLHNIYGSDGFGNLTYKKQVNRRYIQKENGIEFINRLVTNKPNKIILILLGALTNTAIVSVMRRDFMENIQEIFIMGGNYGEAISEFNFKIDPEAANVVFNTTRKPTTVLPWETCSNKNIDFKWRFNIKLLNPVWDLMEAAERSAFGNNSLVSKYELCDGIIALAFLYPELITKTSKHCAVVDIGDISRGQIIIKSGCNNNVVIIEEFDTEKYKKLFVDEFKNVCVLNRCRNEYL